MILWLIIASFVPSTFVYQGLHEEHISKLFFGIWGIRIVFLIGTSVVVVSIAEKLQPRKKELEVLIKIANNEITKYDGYKTEAIKKRDEYQNELDNLKK